MFICLPLTEHDTPPLLFHLDDHTQSVYKRISQSYNQKQSQACNHCHVQTVCFSYLELQRGRLVNDPGISNISVSILRCSLIEICCERLEILVTLESTLWSGMSFGLIAFLLFWESLTLIDLCLVPLSSFIDLDWLKQLLLGKAPSGGSMGI